MARKLERPGIGGGVGIKEEDIHATSGLRMAVDTPVLITSTNAIAAITLGTPTGAPITTWKPMVGPVDLPFYFGHPAYPVTPTVFMITPAPAVTKQLRIRMTGTDQFGVTQTETSPWVAHLGGATDVVVAFPMSKVFQYVALIEIMTVGYNSTTDFAQIGQLNCFDPTNIADDAADLQGVTILHRQNLGFGTTRRLSPNTDGFRVYGNIGAYNWTQRAFAYIAPVSGTVAGFTVGQSVAGFEGYQHKIGFDSPNWAATKVQQFGGGEFRMGGQVQGSPPPPIRARDVLEFHVTLRSDLGLRDSHPQTSYAFG